MQGIISNSDLEKSVTKVVKGWNDHLIGNDFVSKWYTPFKRPADRNLVAQELKSSVETIIESEINHYQSLMPDSDVNERFQNVLNTGIGQINRVIDAKTKYDEKMTRIFIDNWKTYATGAGVGAAAGLLVLGIASTLEPGNRLDYSLVFLPLLIALGIVTTNTNFVRDLRNEFVGEVKIAYNEMKTSFYR